MSGFDTRRGKKARLPFFVCFRPKKFMKYEKEKKHEIRSCQCLSKLENKTSQTQLERSWRSNYWLGHLKIHESTHACVRPSQGKCHAISWEQHTAHHSSSSSCKYSICAENIVKGGNLILTTTVIAITIVASRYVTMVWGGKAHKKSLGAQKPALYFFWHKHCYNGRFIRNKWTISWNRGFQICGLGLSWTKYRKNRSLKEISRSCGLDRTTMNCFQASTPVRRPLAPQRRRGPASGAFQDPVHETEYCIFKELGLVIFSETPHSHFWIWTIFVT